MKAKNCLIFGGSGQIGRNLIRKLTKKNYKVTVVTRNIHQKSYIIKTQANAGYIDIVESNIFEEQKLRILKKLEIGQVLEGTVKNMTNFGVFVDLGGGIDALLHITDISWGRVNHPSEMIELNDDITVKVIEYDSERKRVSLGLKQLTPHPWEEVEIKYPIGSTVQGTIVSLTNYGAFIEIEPGVEGLIHVSEISWTLFSVFP